MISSISFHFAARFLKAVLHTWHSHLHLCPRHHLPSDSVTPTVPTKVDIDLSVLGPEGCFQSSPISLRFIQHCWQLLPFPLDFCDSTFSWLPIDLLGIPSCVLCNFFLLHQTIKYQNSQLFVLAPPHFLLCFLSRLVVLKCGCTWGIMGSS